MSRSKMFECSPQRDCVKLTEFKYEDSPSKKITKPKSGQNKKQSIPIKTLIEKMGGKSQFESKHSNVMFHSQQNFINSSTIKGVSAKNWDFLTPRDSMYIAKPQMFNRYNYQNYNGYEYKNPFRPPKYPIQDKMLNKKSIKNNPRHGSDKNLQVVFCEKKHQDFVKKTNEQVKVYYNELKSKTTVDGRTRRSVSQAKLTKRKTSSQNLAMLQKLRKSLTLGKKKSTLANYLQEFTTLEKLSNYMERQHKLNEKYFFASSQDSSRTVLLDILIHRFQFLKAMKKKARDLILQFVLGIDEISNFHKINIHEYIKFNELFIARDADPGKIGIFIFVFLFKRSQSTTKQATIKSMELLDGSAALHQFTVCRLVQIVEQSEQNSKNIYHKLIQDLVVQKAFIDLILSHHHN